MTGIAIQLWHTDLELELLVNLDQFYFKIVDN